MTHTRCCPSALSGRSASAALLLLGLLQAARPAFADALPSSSVEDRLTATLLLGPSVGLSPAQLEVRVFDQVGTANYPSPTQLRLEQRLEYRLGTDDARRDHPFRGFSAGLSLIEGFGGDHTSFSVLPGASLTLGPFRGERLYIGSAIGLGYAYFSRSSRALEDSGASAHGLAFVLAAEARVKLASHFAIVIRPLVLEIVRMNVKAGDVQDGGTFVRAALQVGCAYGI